MIEYCLADKAGKYNRKERGGRGGFLNYNAMNEPFEKDEDRIASIVVDCALRVHKELGPGLLESSYEICLAYELRKAGLSIEVQKGLPIIYANIKLDAGYRIDILAEQKVIIELKSVETLNNIHIAQMLTYLKLSKCKLGILLNFNVSYLKNGGIRRIANGL